MDHHCCMAVLDFKQVLDAKIQRVPFPEDLAALVVRIDTQIGVDSTGGQAVYISVVLKDATPPEHRSFLHLKPLGGLLRRAVYELKGGPSVVAATPYVRFVTESELSESES